ncbi:MAG TPA: hypothetical protein VH415_06095 [Nitrososphaeraceae archaeon]
MPVKLINCHATCGDSYSNLCVQISCQESIFSTHVQSTSRRNESNSGKVEPVSARVNESNCGRIEPNGNRVKRISTDIIESNNGGAEPISLRVIESNNGGAESGGRGNE